MIDTGPEHLLEECRAAFELGNVLALIDAIKICAIHRVAMPEWMVGPLLDHFVENATSGKRGRRGRNAKPMANAMTMLLDFLRWSTIQNVLSDLETEPGTKVKLYAAFDDARARLHGTIARGSVKTMERSYQLVERAIKKAGGRGRTYLPRPDTLEDFDIELPED